MDESHTYDVVTKQIDSLIKSGHLPSATAVDDWVAEKAASRGGKSKLSIRGVSHDLAYATYFRWLSGWVTKHGERIPEYGTLERDVYISKVWRTEPILAGAVYSMASKMVSLKWQIIGGRNLAIYFANLLSRTAYMGGYGWGGFSSTSAQDFYTTNNGVFWESPRNGNYMYGRLADLGHIDSLLCTLTGNVKRPVHYVSDTTGQSIRFRNGEVIHFASMNSPREERLGVGFCAVDRALKAAKLLMGLYAYDSEKLANLPPEGVAAVTGLTMDEFQDALALWQSARVKDNSLTFPQVLWLIGSQPNAKVSIDMVGFSQLPEAFDRSTVVVQYVNTLALDFGVDAREFWPISSGALGTVGESEIQHMKARGKGHGEYVSITERVINDEMPDGVEFGYDTQDMEEDKSAAEVAKAWIAAYLPLTVAGGAAEEIISKEELMRLLADKDVIPDWMVKDDRVVADDMGVHEKQWTHDNVICIEWDGKVLKQKRGPSIDLSYRMVGYDGSFPEAEVLKGGPGSGHRGHAGRPGLVGGSVAEIGGVAVLPDKYEDDYGNVMDVYSIKRGDRLPKHVINAKEITFALDSKGVLHVTTPLAESHAELAYVMGVSGADYDNWIRGIRHPTLGEGFTLTVDTAYKGALRAISSYRWFPTDAEAAAEAIKNLKRLSRSMRSAGFPDDQLLMWDNNRGSDITLPLNEWKEYGYDGSFPEAGVLKGGPGSGHYGHAGRPGSVGGSLSSGVAMSVRTGRAAAVRRGWVPEKLPKVETDPGLVLTQVVDKASDIEDGEWGKGYFVRSDDSLVDVTSDFGGGTNDHVGYIVVLENSPELLGLDPAVVNSFKKINNALYVTEEYGDWGTPGYRAADSMWLEKLGDMWDSIFDAGNFRVREHVGRGQKRVIAIDGLSQHRGFKRVQNLVATGVITSDKTATYLWEGMGKETFLSFSWHDLMTASSARDLQYSGKEYRGSDSRYRHVDAATEFLKQDATTEEPKRNIRGKPVPEGEALRGSEITQTAIKAEMELWRKHPELSKYMTESAGGS